MAPSGKTNIDRLAIVLVATNVTGVGAQGTYFGKDPVPMRQGEPGSFLFGLDNVQGPFTNIVINIEFSPTLGANEYWEVLDSWTPLTTPFNGNVVCAESGYFRINVTTFTGGTSFNVWCTVANGAAGTGSSSSGGPDVNIHDSTGASLLSDGGGALKVAVVSGGGSNPSVGPTGSAVPADATAIGFEDGSNNLQIPSATNPLPVTVGNFPATQPVSGTVAVSNFPATQPVSGTVTANQGGAPWSVTFPSAQHVIVDSATLGTVTVTGTVAATQSGSWTVTANQGTSPWVVSLASTTITGTVAVTQSTSPWVTKDAADQTIGAAVSTTAIMAGFKDNSGNVQFGSLDSTGALKVSGTSSGGSVSATLFEQTQFVSTNNSTSGSFTTGQIFTGVFEAVYNWSAIWVTITATQNGTLEIDWSDGGASVDSSDTFTITANIGFEVPLNPHWQFFRVKYTNGTGTSTVNLRSRFLPVAQAFPRALTQAGNFKVAVEEGTVSVSGPIGVTQSTSPWVENVSQFGGSAVVTGTGAGGAGIPRVTVSNDSNILATQSGTWNVGITGTVAATQSGTWTVQQGSAPWSVSQSGTWNVGTLTSITNPVTVVGDAAAGSNVAGNPVLMGGSDYGGTPKAQTVKVDSSGQLYIGNTVAVSGTVTANQGTSPWVVSLTSTTITGTVAVTQSGTWTVATNADGSLTGGTAGSKSLAVGGVYNSSAPILTNGQQASLQLDSSGNLKIAGTFSGGNAAAGPTGSAVPADADYVGFNSGGNLVGVSSSNPLPTAETSIVAQGSTTSGQSGPLIQAAVVSGSPTYTAGKTSPLTLDTQGRLIVTGSVVISSGSVTASQSGAWTSNIFGHAGSAMDVAQGGATAAANALQVAGVYNSSAPTLSNGQGAALQFDVNGNLKTTSGGTVTVTGTVAATQSGNWTDRIVGNAGATLDAVVTAATAPANGLAVLGVQNTTQINPTNGQSAALQIDPAANLLVANGVVLKTLSAQGTTLNSTQTIFSLSGCEAVIVQLTQTTTLTAGAITFEFTYDGSNWSAVPANDVVDPTSSTYAPISLPYTVQANTNKQFLILCNGATGLRIRTSTAITGTGSVTPNYALLNYDPLPQVSIVGTPTVNQGTSPWVTNISQWGGTNVSAATAGVPDINVKNIGNSAVSTAASGVQKVGIVGNAGGAFDAATAATAPANAIQSGSLGKTTALPSAVSDGQLVAQMSDKFGRQIVLPQVQRDLVGTQTTNIASSTAETTIVTAIASTFCDITGFQITNASATAVTVTIKDSTAGTTRKKYDLAANGGIVVHFSPPLPQLAGVNNNWTATLSVNTVTVDVNVDYVKNS